MKNYTLYYRNYVFFFLKYSICGHVVACANTTRL